MVAVVFIKGVKMMTKETVLTEELIDQLADKYLWGHDHFLGVIEGTEEFARAIEQAVLQSPEIQALKRDAERLDWLADVNNTICTVLLPRDIVERNLGSLRDGIDDAMEQQHD